jgi:hypothetical protein
MARSEADEQPDVRALLRPHSSDAMEFYPVDDLVNNSKHDSPACIAPLPLRRPAKESQPGQLVRVQHCPHAYRLPEGLKPGTVVKLLSWHSGGWTLEANGRRWNISMTNVDPGDECSVAGEWRYESDGMVKRELARLAKWTVGGASVGR